jgi:uncharacterized DUF497 family protein
LIIAVDLQHLKENVGRPWLTLTHIAQRVADMSKPYPSEPLHADINWSEEDNKRNGEKYGISFEDIQSGFARPHVRQALTGQGEFIALIEVETVVFEVRCRIDLNLTIIAADVATPHAQTTYRKTLSQRP